MKRHAITHWMSHLRTESFGVWQTRTERSEGPLTEPPLLASVSPSCTSRHDLSLVIRSGSALRADMHRFVLKYDHLRVKHFRAFSGSPVRRLFLCFLPDNALRLCLALCEDAFSSSEC